MKNAASQPSHQSPRNTDRCANGDENTVFWPWTGEEGQRVLGFCVTWNGHIT